jgi:hypothetical protein
MEILIMLAWKHYNDMPLRINFHSSQDDINKNIDFYVVISKNYVKYKYKSVPFETACAIRGEYRSILSALLNSTGCEVFCSDMQIPINESIRKIAKYISIIEYHKSGIEEIVQTFGAQGGLKSGVNFRFIVTKNDIVLLAHQEAHHSTIKYTLNFPNRYDNNIEVHADVVNL